MEHTNLDSAGERGHPPLPSSFRVEADVLSTGSSSELPASQEAMSISSLRSNQDDQNDENNLSDNINEVFFGANDDDDDSSVSSNSSDEFSTGEDMRGLSLQERAERNQERNALFLKTLHQKYQDRLPSRLQKTSNKKRKSNPSDYQGALSDDEEEVVRRGMIHLEQNSKRESNETFEEAIQRLTAKYPHRHDQIRKLAALLHAPSRSISFANSSTIHVPPPIFLTGPRGCGKTSVVCDALSALGKQSKYNNDSRLPKKFLRTAYVDCLTVEPSTIERLVLDAFQQLNASELMSQNVNQDQGTSERVVAKRQRQSSVSSVGPTTDASKPEVSDAAVDASEQLAQNTSSLKDSQQRMQPRRAAKEGMGAPASLRQAPKPKTAKKKSKAVETSHSAVVSFGRSLHRHFGLGGRYRAILVLDHAERLLSFTARKKQSEKTNYLSELLLLPKVARLNLTIVVISKYSILQGTKLNNLSNTNKSSANLSGVAWATIPFPAYNGNYVLKEILRSRHLLDSMIGSKTRHTALQNAFMQKVIDAFLGVTVQIISDSTRDVNEFVRLGRSLWPLYIEPIQPQNIRQTIRSLKIDESIPPERSDAVVIAYLGKRLYSQVGKASGDILHISLDSPLGQSSLEATAIPSRPYEMSDSEQPFLRDCLLLAAFICQHNRADQDKKIFSVHGNGRRKSRNHGSSARTEGEDVAFGSTSMEVEQLRSLRPRPFLLERVFSIFVTLVRLNPDCPRSLPGRPQKINTSESIGKSSLYRDVSQLMDLRLLHPVGYSGSVKGEQMNLNLAKFWCSLTKEEATSLAKRNNIPIDSYLV